MTGKKVMTILENPHFYTRRQFFVASPFHVSLRIVICIVVVKLSLNTLSRISGPKSCCIVVCREMKNMSHAQHYCLVGAGTKLQGWPLPPTLDLRICYNGRPSRPQSTHSPHPSLIARSDFYR